MHPATSVFLLFYELHFFSREGRKQDLLLLLLLLVRGVVLGGVVVVVVKVKPACYFNCTCLSILMALFGDCKGVFIK